MLGCFGRTWLASTPANLRFAHFTTRVAQRHFTNQGAEALCSPRQASRFVGMKQHGGKSCNKHGSPRWPHPRVSRHSVPAARTLRRPASPKHLPVVGLCTPPLSTIWCSQAVAEARDRETQDYQRWLLGASVKGMKPLFRAVKKQEAIVVRPFLNEPAEARPFLRLRQWARLWDAQGTPPPFFPHPSQN